MDGFAAKATGSYLVRLLRELGYRASLRITSPIRLFTMAGNFRSRIQAGFVSWGADFPTASNFFLPVLSCQSFNGDPASNNNYAEFCDPHADKLVGEAQAAQLTDPATARKLWAQVDRIVTDQAPWIPVSNEEVTAFVSARVGNCQVSPVYGPLLDQMWVW